MLQLRIEHQETISHALPCYESTTMLSLPWKLNTLQCGERRERANKFN